MVGARLEYGLPVQLADDLAQGRHVVANGSRDTIAALAACVARLVIIEVTADPIAVAERLKTRGRESGEALIERTTRATRPFPGNVETINVANDTDAAGGTERLVAALVAAAGRES